MQGTFHLMRLSFSDSAGPILKKVRVLALLALCCAAVSCGRRDNSDAVFVPQDAAEIIATVGTGQLTRVEFEAELARRSRGLEDAFSSPAALEKLLAEMIRSKAALARARASDFDQQPEVVRRIEELIVSRYLEETLDFKPTGEQQISDDEVSSYYAAHLDQFGIPPAIRAGIIVLEISEKATAEKRGAARVRAEAIRIEALQANAKEFNRLVQQHSRDQSTRYVGGDTGWLSAEEAANRWPKEVIQAALSLKSPGEIAPIVETAGNLFIVRLNERREAATRPLTEVADAIRYQMLQSQFQQRQETFARELTNGLAIRMNREALAKVKTIPNTKPPVPPALPD